MAKVKISEMTTGSIAPNDLVPFVQVPSSGIKSNKKTTFSDLKTAVLQGLSLPSTGGVCTPSTLIFKDVNDVPLVSEYLIANEIVPENSPIIGTINYTANYVNTSTEDVLVKVDLPLICYAAVDTNVLTNLFRDTSHAWAKYKIELLAEGLVLGTITRTVDFFKTQEGFLVKNIELHDDNLTGNIIVPASSAKLFSLRLNIIEFICRSVPNGTQQALHIRIAHAILPNNSFNCFTFKISQSQL